MTHNNEDAVEKKHPLLTVWNRHPGFLQSKTEMYRLPSIEKIIAELFSVGAYYYYTLQLRSSTLSNHHPDILKMHSLTEFPRHLGDIIDLIHPDDLTFVQEAELMTLEDERNRVRTHDAA